MHNFSRPSIDFFCGSIIIIVMEKSRKRQTGKKIAVLGILAGLGLAAFLLESLIPIPFLPGAKLGFANIFSLTALLLYGLPEALAVVLVRTVLGSLFAGNVSMLLYSLTAGVVSAALSRLLLCLLPHISFLAVSVAGAVVHNLVQLFVYCALTGTLLLFAYSPYLTLMGAAAGVVVGLIVTMLCKSLPARAVPALRQSISKEDKT